jgi:peptidylprolyl isomerase
MRSLIIATLILAAIPFNNTLAQTRRHRTPARRAQRALAERAPKPVASSSAAITTASGLTYLITHHGQGRQPKAGEMVVVHYTGMLTNGVKFDSSRDRDEPITFRLGVGRVIKGWDEGIALLHIGDQAILLIPPQLGYGETGNGAIPPGATLIFIVELVDIKETSVSQVFREK